MDRGRVFGTEGGVYRVRLDSGEEAEASLRGRLRREARTGDRVVIGDEVVLIGRQNEAEVTVEELASYANREVIVTTNGHQHPQWGNVEGRGTILLWDARRVPTEARARRIPREMVAGFEADLAKIHELMDVHIEVSKQLPEWADRLFRRETCPYALVNEQISKFMKERAGD